MNETSNHIKQRLAGRTVVVAGPQTKLNDYVNELERSGADVIICPEIEIAEPESYTRLDEALEHLYGYDWLLFTNENGVEHLLGRLQRFGLEVNALDELRVCAIGDAAERLLRDAQVHVDVAPPAPDTSTIFSALEQFVGGLGELRGLNFLSPRSAFARDSLTRALRDAGARVDVVPAYSLLSTPEKDLGRLAAMLSGAADCLVLLNPAAVAGLARLFDAHDLGEPLGEIVIIAVDDITLKAAEEYGLRTEGIPAKPDAVTLAQSAADCF